MSSVSLCMIVKDEEPVIARCLDSVRDLVEEIVIVDTGSSDRTKEIASEYTDKIYDFEWIDDFAAARNFSFSKATKDYIMWLDADDVLTEENRESFLVNKNRLDPSVCVVMMKYHTAFDESDRPVFSYYRERILRRDRKPRWVGAVHEVIPRSGKTVYWDTAVTHRKVVTNDPDRNLRIFEKLIRSGRKLDRRQQFYYGRELMGHGRYEEAEDIFEDFLRAKDGWIEDRITACRDLFSCRLRMGREDAAAALFGSFLYGSPRAEVCCDIGSWFMEKEQYETASWWYEAALRCKRDSQAGGFYSPDCYGFLPCLQLCVCYDRLGDTEKAYSYHKKSQLYKPENASVLYNEKYFEAKRKRIPDTGE